MTICWHENAEDRPTFESLYTRLDDFGSLTEPNYRDVRQESTFSCNQTYRFFLSSSFQT